ncbi:helix-turn-helix domain-containing protein [Porcipelethomonas ammoniilytica]|uniref:helix-turn-helix domain-containing protein n=1 Tax=Porcipelethomonas ammoniilytica TaxID=2981722 RepID=UPI0011C7F49B
MVSKSTVAHYEQGINSPPLDVIIKLSKYFEVPVDYILGICGSKIEYHRLADNCTDNFTYGEIANFLYSLPANAQNHVCFLLNIIKKSFSGK